MSFRWLGKVNEYVGVLEVLPVRPTVSEMSGSRPQVILRLSRVLAVWPRVTHGMVHPAGLEPLFQAWRGVWRASMGALGAHQKHPPAYRFFRLAW